MGDPIINTQVDAINATLGNIKVDLASLRPSIRTIKDAIAETYITDTIENVPIASLSDGADEIPVRELQVAINPIQSLNGQTSPYPAGGGKNKFVIGDYTGTIGNVQYAYTASNNKMTASGECNSGGGYNIGEFSVPSGTYTFSADFSNFIGSVSVYLRDKLNNTNIVYIAKSNPTASVALDGDYYVRVGATSGTSNSGYIEQFQVELGSSKTAYAPPSNICPISGHTEVNVYDDPKYGGTIKWNQYIQPSAIPATKTVKDVTFTNNGDGSFTTSGTASGLISGTDYLIIASTTLVSGHKYVLKGCPSGGSSSTYYAYDGYTHIDNGNGYLGALNLARFYVYIKSGTNVTGLTWKPQFIDLTEMFGAGNEPTLEEFKALFPKSYYPYNAGELTCVSAVNGDPYTKQTISLGQTVYGGTLNVTTGVLTIDRAMISDLGTLTWTKAGSGRHNANITQFTGIKIVSNAETINAVCSQYTPKDGNGIVNQDMSFGIVNGNVLQINDSTLNGQDAATFKAAMSGVQLVYELDTPTTVQLTAAEVETLFGANNVWSDSNGNVVKLTYRKAWEIALAQGE